MMRSRLVTAVILAALTAAVSAQDSTRSQLDAEIVFLEARVSRDAADPIDRKSVV